MNWYLQSTCRVSTEHSARHIESALELLRLFSFFQLYSQDAFTHDGTLEYTTPYGYHLTTLTSCYFQHEADESPRKNDGYDSIGD